MIRPPRSESDRPSPELPSSSPPSAPSSSGTGRLAFIVGHYKSGSTWLANLLSLHPQIQGIRETHVFRYTADDETFRDCTEQLFSSVAWAGGGYGNLVRHRVGNWLRPLRRSGQATLRPSERPATLLDLPLRAHRRLRHELAIATDRDDYRRRFFQVLLEEFRPGAFLLEKTPTNMPWVPEIRRVFPKSKLISIHRDGRDVVVSDKFHLRNEYGRDQAFDESVRRWKDAMEAQLAFAEEHGVFCLSYEQLMGDCRPIVEKLLAFLELPTSDETIDDMIERSSFRFVTGRDLGSESPDSFYRKGGAGDWVNHLDSAKRARFAEIAGDLLVRLGYEENDHWV